tara:strand:+ start:675 stop:1031 length:357 start_codon:yes stop_codon:yes gene_type:complete
MTKQMTGKKRSTPAIWNDPDDAPELTAAFFKSADLYEGTNNKGEEHMTCPDRQWVGLTNEEIEQLSIDAGIITWVKRVYDDVDKKFYDLPLGEGMEGDGISLKQFANLVSTRLKEKNT